MKIVVGASSFASASQEAKELLEGKGVELLLNPYGRKLTKEETIEFIDDADGILAGLELLDEEVFAKCDNLKAVSRIGIGMDNVDMEAARKHGIKVSNTPDGPTEAVAEMALTALLTLSRRVISVNSSMHMKKWKKELGVSLHGKSILFVGYGRIGKKFAELLEPFSMNIFISDPVLGDESVKIDDVIDKVDIITIHASCKFELIGEKQFEKMKKNVIILNSARGIIVNEQALYNALLENREMSAWLDVYFDEPYVGGLCECENALLTSHICSYTDKCRKEMEMQAVKNIIKDLGI